MLRSDSRRGHKVGEKRGNAQNWIIASLLGNGRELGMNNIQQR